MAKPFQKINIEISNICNLQCSFCPEVIRTKQLMPLDLFQQIIQQAAPLTEQVCFHLMGDPLVHPKLTEMVKICEQEKVSIFFVTNGVLLRPEKYQLLTNPAFRQINFSLHSFPDNFPQKNFATYLEQIFNFVDFAFEKRPDLYINFRLWNLSEPANKSASDPAEAKEKNQSMLESICKKYDVPMISKIDVRTKKSWNLKNRLYLHFDTEFIWPSLDLPVLGTTGTCYGLSSHFGILVDGTVVPCCLDKEGNIPLGRIQDQPLVEILNSSKSKAIRDGFKRKKLLEGLCQRCQYIERFQTNKTQSQIQTDLIK